MRRSDRGQRRAAHDDPVVGKCIEGIHLAGKRVREDFMNFVWINDVLIAGARQLLDGGAPESRKCSAGEMTP